MNSDFAPDQERTVEGAGERRSESRIPIKTEVSLASDSQFFTALTGNLSLGGLFVATYQPMAIGSAVSMQIALPDGELHVTGVVRWIREVSSGALPGLGVAFDSLDEASAERIAKFCALREPLLHDDD
jgi:uncharacterized protein (TIGR02266 family)